MSQDTKHNPVTPLSNPIKHALREGKVCVGVAALTFTCPASAQISAEAGYTFFYFDMEHSGLSINAVESICTAAKLAGITPIGGSSGIVNFTISRLLDNGAMGIIVPQIKTREETEIVVNACYYHPEGSRGFLGYGALMDYHVSDAAMWTKKMNEEILCGVKVESELGIKNIEQITNVPGLDAVLVGTGDLSVTMNIPGEMNNPKLQKAIDRVIEVCNRKKIACGPHVNDPEEVKKWSDRGATFMTCGFDGQLLLEASRERIQKAQSLLGDKMFKMKQTL